MTDSYYIFPRRWTTYTLPTSNNGACFNEIITKITRIINTIVYFNSSNIYINTWTCINIFTIWWTCNRLPMIICWIIIYRNPRNTKIIWNINIIAIYSCLITDWCCVNILSSRWNTNTLPIFIRRWTYIIITSNMPIGSIRWR